MNRGCDRTIGRKTRIRRCDGESAKCNGSSRLVPLSVFSACTPPSTTPSTSNAISSRGQRCGSSEPRRQTNGEMRLPQRDSVLCPTLLPQSSVPVPFLGERGTALEKILPVFRHQQFDLFERLPAWRRRCAVLGRMKIQVFAHCPLSEIGKIPVQKKSRRIGVGPVGWDSPGFRRGRQPRGGRIEPDRRTLFLPLEVSGILCGVNDLVLLVDQPVELLDVRIKAFGFQLAELPPIIRAVEAPQLKPGNVLQARSRQLDRDSVRPFRIDRFL